MIREIYTNFKTQKAAKQALTLVKRKYRCALRGSVVAERGYPAKHWRVLADGLDVAGFSSAELAGALEQFNLHVVKDTLCPDCKWSTPCNCKATAPLGYISRESGSSLEK